MLFNTSTKYDFEHNLHLEGQEILSVEEIDLLGIRLRSDLNWNRHTDSIVGKAFKRLWVLRRLKNLGASRKDLVEVFTIHVRPLLEFAVPVWHSNLNQKCSNSIERVQKAAVKIILQGSYKSYKNALIELNMHPLSQRRDQLCLNFALKCEAHVKFSHWFKPNTTIINTRSKKDKYCNPVYKTTRLKNSPLSYLTLILNRHYQENS